MKSELTVSLRNCQAALEKRDNTRDNMFRAKKKLDDLRCPPDLRKYGGDKFSPGAFLVVGFVAVVFGNLFFNKLGGLGTKLLILGISAVIAIVPGVLVGRRTYEKKTAKIQQENEQMMAKYQAFRRENERRFEAEYQQCRERAYHAEKEASQLAQSCGLHQNYQDARCVGYLLHYLETGRSDSLKEAINLYEQERREDARDEAAARHRREMQRQAAAIYAETVRSADAAEEAARRADDAAFWGAAATAVACVSAAEAKKSGQSGEYHVV